MAFTVQEKDELRQLMDRAAITGAVTWQKANANAVFDAIDAWFESVAVQASLSAAIDAAFAGLTNAQKRRFVRAWVTKKVN